MNNQVDFKIFTRKKGLIFTVNRVVYPLLLGSLGIAYLADKYLNQNVLESIGTTGGIIGCILMIYFNIAKLSTRKPLNGDLSKRLIFCPSEIIIDSQKIDLKEIKKIEFSVTDYFDRFEYSIRGDLNPCRSNGTSNLCELKLVNGENIRVNFQLMYEGEFLKMRELLLEYYFENKIHFLRLIEYLEIQEYQEIQEFKKTLTPSKLSI
ncbi:hypothetical protein Oweho_1241 [Owenweeksia hongkongensis DSM 17368]|uniref:Uncharacterized protein n=1 Tax=Owenweeksia hongkongensis (strain DSM 17368 / CIP 108786 / JCM 12287 / NRRL B-23963 / UST20020801) TaxID=926562 RepID=G8R656_OWEHD|nr:hypothetical protein [Owenweeksia hongkongensis]AEV32246.1 hypothetical protein Oweho_1241 [Owenweeksia hongkongensis DSM 17368]